jgi:hypothetical protein
MKKIRSTLVAEPFWKKERGHDKIDPDAISSFEVGTKKSSMGFFGTPVEYQGLFGLTGRVDKFRKRPDEFFFI